MDMIGGTMLDRCQMTSLSSFQSMKHARFLQRHKTPRAAGEGSRQRPRSSKVGAGACLEVEDDLYLP
jgi:hypothetical protein